MPPTLRQLHLGLYLLLSLLLCPDHGASAATPTTSAAPPHLFYLHGCCVANAKDPKAKDYARIVEQFKQHGFQVHFSLWPMVRYDNNTGVHTQAEKVAAQIQTLLAQGTPPEQITVAGYSLGARTALVVSGLVANPRVNYVLLAGCARKPSLRISVDYAKVQGRVLAITDAADGKFGSCTDLLPRDVRYQEEVLHSGQGHALFRHTDPSQVALWLPPLVSWTKTN